MKSSTIPVLAPRSTRALVALMLLAGGYASAQELIVNGGFETGDFTGWTQFGDTSFTSVLSSGSHGGTYHGQFGPLTPGGIQQALTGVTAGQSLFIGFWYYAGNVATGDFMSAAIGNITFFNVTSAPTGWTQFTTTLIAPSNNPMLTFTFQNNPSYWHIDDIGMPEPPAGAAIGLPGGAPAKVSAAFPRSASYLLERNRCLLQECS